MRRLLVPLLALALVAPACSMFGEAPAATVGGTEISTSSIDHEIETIRTNDGYTQYIEQSYGAIEGAAGTGTFNAAVVAQLLSLRVWYRLLEDDIVRRDLRSMLDDVVAEMRETIPAQFDQAFGDGTFDEFPADYRDDIIRQQAIPEVIKRWITEQIGDDPRAFYEENEEEFAEICVSHVLVGVQGGRSPDDAQADAEDLYRRIQDGEDFTDIATDESDDPGAAAEGGALGCGSKLSLQFDPVFEKAAFSLPVDEVSEPVQTQFGSHLILVTSREIPSYSSVGAEEVQQVMAQALEGRVNDYLVEVICDGDVDVNPRYGTWRVESCSGLTPRIPMVEPPEGPAGSVESTSVPGQ